MAGEPIAYRSASHTTPESLRGELRSFPLPLPGNIYGASLNPEKQLVHIRVFGNPYKHCSKREVTPIY